MGEREGHLVIESLCQAFSERGRSAYTSGSQVRALLADGLGDRSQACHREIGLVAAAADDGVPDALIEHVGPLDSAINRSAITLATRHGFTAEAAMWAVRSWMTVLEIADEPTPTDATNERPSGLEPRAAVPIGAPRRPTLVLVTVAACVALVSVLVLGLVIVMTTSSPPETNVLGIESPNDGDVQLDVTITGVCADRTMAIEVENHGAAASDYEVEVAFASKGTSIGSGTGSATGVDPGDTATIFIVAGRRQVLGFIRPPIFGLVSSPQQQRTEPDCAAVISRVTRYDAGTDDLN